ncbi:hypothetical protein INT46_000634, partial [Mucor plumbeus]
MFIENYNASPVWVILGSEDELDVLPEGQIDINKYDNFKLYGHATLACYKAAKKVNPLLRIVIESLETSGRAKVALNVILKTNCKLELQAIALSLGLPAQTIQDAGRTQIVPGPRTVLGVEPGPAELANK